MLTFVMDSNVWKYNKTLIIDISALKMIETSFQGC